MRKPFDDRLPRTNRPPVPLEPRFTKIGCFTETREDRIARIARLRRPALEQPATADCLVSDAEVSQHVMAPAPRPTP
jgi:hypothetical protein